MNLNRGLIKQQAKGLLQNNILKLFVIQLIVLICMNAVSGVVGGIVNVFSISSTFSSVFDRLDDYDFDDSFDFDEDFNNYGYGSDNNDFNQFGQEFGDFDFSDDFNSFGYGTDDYDFEGNFNNFGYGYENTDPQFSQKDSAALFAGLAAFSGVFMLLSLVAALCEILLSPLDISLSGYFVSFIRGNKADVGDGLSSVFRNTFKNNYGKKIALAFLRSLFCGLLCMLFIIPGIIYYYSTYFSFQIMCDNPEISPTQALELSRKMVRGNRWELFVLNLSFIPWHLLCIFVFPIIYVMPYVATTDALYYENFRIRALQEGRITEDDFLSSAQKYAKYANAYGNPYYQQQNGGQYQQNAQYQYNTNQQPPYGQPNYNPQTGYYQPQPGYNPAQNVNPAYQQPVPPNQPVNTPDTAATQTESAVENAPQAEPAPQQEPAVQQDVQTDSVPAEETQQQTILNGEPLDENNN